MPTPAKTWLLSLLAISGLVVVGYSRWPTPVAAIRLTTYNVADDHEPATSDAPSTTPRKNPSAGATADQAAVANVGPCAVDSNSRLLQYYRQLLPQDWRRLNDWQRERGLSQTRLRADGELAQEPSPYIYYDLDTLSQLATTDDADARYWLAMKYRESGQPVARLGNNREDASLVIASLLSSAANMGHVQAMLAISNGFYQQSVNASAPDQSPVDAYPDLQIKARAWQHVAAWRLGRLPERDNALPAALELQAAQLAVQLIRDIQQTRQQQGLPELDNVVSAVLVDLLRAVSDQGCAQKSLATSVATRTPTAIAHPPSP